jgi:hypothetical protein
MEPFEVSGRPPGPLPSSAAIASGPVNLRSANRVTRRAAFVRPPNQLHPGSYANRTSPAAMWSLGADQREDFDGTAFVDRFHASRRSPAPREPSGPLPSLHAPRSGRRPQRSPHGDTFTCERLLP